MHNSLPSRKLGFPACKPATHDAASHQPLPNPRKGEIPVHTAEDQSFIPIRISRSEKPQDPKIQVGIPGTKLRDLPRYRHLWWISHYTRLRASEYLTVGLREGQGFTEPSGVNGRSGSSDCGSDKWSAISCKASRWSPQLPGQSMLTALNHQLSLLCAHTIQYILFQPQLISYTFPPATSPCKEITNPYSSRLSDRNYPLDFNSTGSKLWRLPSPNWTVDRWIFGEYPPPHNLESMETVGKKN